MKIHKFPFQIAYADTDAGGIAYHARYIEIAERARMNWFKVLNLNCVPSNGDIGLVINSLSIKYMRPLRVSDEIIVESVVVEPGAASMKVEQKFTKDGEVYAVMQIKIAYIGADARPKRIPAEWLIHF